MSVAILVVVTSAIFTLKKYWSVTALIRFPSYSFERVLIYVYIHLRIFILVCTNMYHGRFSIRGSWNVRNKKLIPPSTSGNFFRICTSVHTTYTYVYKRAAVVSFYHAFRYFEIRKGSAKCNGERKMLISSDSLGMRVEMGTSGRGTEIGRAYN